MARIVPIIRCPKGHSESKSASLLRILWLLAAATFLVFTIGAKAAGIGPVEGGAVPQPLPLFPASNWWNLDISTAPVDPNSSAYIAFVNNGGTRHLHPDMGGDVSPGSVDIYGMPYVVVDGTQAKVAVQFQYSDESDGVDHTTNQSYPFYPIPTQAISQMHWIECGAPGSVDQRSGCDRHLLIIDRDNKYLYELYNVWYDGTKWQGGSGAFFDMNASNRRPDGWTSADAAGLAIVPGLVRYDEVYNAYGTSITDIKHAFRVTVRSTNGYVYPASHRAGSTGGALPMGARLRLKASKDISGFTPEMQKVFRAMKTYGLIVADNGSDMYISGTYDTNWNNDVLNPAFGALSASDFEVVQLGWNPAPATASLTAVSVAPNVVVGGNNATGTAQLSSAAPASGAVVSLGVTGPASVPVSVTIPAGATSANFTIATGSVSVATNATITGTYAGVAKSATLTINPPSASVTLSSLSVNPSVIPNAGTATGTVTLSGSAPTGGVSVALASSNTAAATVPASIVIPAGSSSASFGITAKLVNMRTTVTISASYAGTTKTASLTIKKIR
jgi:hypothetical protein